MKLSLRPFKMLLPLLLACGLEQAFWEFLVKDSDDSNLLHYELAMLILGLGTVLWYWKRLEPTMSRAVLCTMAYLLGMMLESYATHGTWIIYLHVFSKVLSLFMIYGTYAYYYNRGMPPLKQFVGILFVVLLLNLAFIHPEALSLKAFLDNDRGFSATSALMLLLPTMLCLNWYLQRGNGLTMGLFLMGLGLIIFLQHRSVWMATLMALPVNLLVLRRVPSARFSLHRVSALVLVPLAILFVGGLATVLQNPAVIKKFETSYEDITKADKQGTGSWRIKQMESYQPLVAERPLMGWRLEGFEVPMQFYDPTSDLPMWADGTGHHFHSFYMDRLFYFGWLGLLLAIVPLFVQIVRRLAYPAPLTAEAAALVGLFAGCLVFGLSYDWPPYMYPLLGLMLAATARPKAAPAAPQPTVIPEPSSRSEPVFAT
ncbi:O-antigen ligase family protein [Hymenobacter terricola]|uniref:O-antigen ligase family protein n=1 Tax=Hymenobacter terricola TaxID=2819236 RepID=UPI001B30A315|nr:O-antigen ligase family protein [Hymenobacter terricola]